MGDERQERIDAGALNREVRSHLVEGLSPDGKGAIPQDIALRVKQIQKFSDYGGTSGGGLWCTSKATSPI